MLSRNNTTMSDMWYFDNNKCDFFEEQVASRVEDHKVPSHKAALGLILSDPWQEAWRIVTRYVIK